jgi:predicted sulfurtransferase
MVAYVFQCNVMSVISDQNIYYELCQRCNNEVCMSGEYSCRQLAKNDKKKYKNNITQSTCQKNANLKQQYSAMSSSLQVT